MRILGIAGNTGGGQYLDGIPGIERLKKRVEETTREFLQKLEDELRANPTDVVLLVGFNDIELYTKVYRECKEKVKKVVMGIDVFFGSVPTMVKCIWVGADAVLLPNQLAKEYIDLWFNGYAEVVGNPAFDNLVKVNKTLDTQKKLVCLFADQGYKNGLQVLKETEEGLRKLGCNFEMYVRPHPERKDDIFKDEKLDTSIVVDWSEYLQQYDIVFGVDSTLNLKAQYMGVPTMYLPSDLMDLSTYVANCIKTSTLLTEYATKVAVQQYKTGVEIFEILCNIGRGVAKWE